MHDWEPTLGELQETIWTLADVLHMHTPTGWAPLSSAHRMQVERCLGLALDRLEPLLRPPAERAPGDA